MIPGFYGRNHTPDHFLPDSTREPLEEGASHSPSPWSKIQGEPKETRSFHIESFLHSKCHPGKSGNTKIHKEIARKCKEHLDTKCFRTSLCKTWTLTTTHRHNQKQVIRKEPTCPRTQKGRVSIHTLLVDSLWDPPTAGSPWRSH